MSQKVHLLALRPTQMALGGLEVKRKTQKYKRLGSRKILKEIKRDPLRIVIGPGGKKFLVDGHHRALALWTSGVVRADCAVIKDFSNSKLSYKKFWHQMKKNGWTHLFDQFGKGPHKPFDLPQDIRGLGDDPYRSLAWLTECAGGFRKTETPFSSFTWALFFRRYKLLKSAFDLDFKKGLKRALQISHNKKARHFPGFISEESHGRRK